MPRSFARVVGCAVVCSSTRNDGVVCACASACRPRRPSSSSPAPSVLLHTPQPNDPPALFQFLGQQKYPASQLYLLMTLGPAITLLPFAERAHGKVASVLSTFGRVPMFYYLLHIPLIHALALIVSIVRSGSIVPWLFGNHPWVPPAQPPGYMWSLGLLYVVFIVAIVLDSISRVGGTPG